MLATIYLAFLVQLGWPLVFAVPLKLYIRSEGCADRDIPPETHGRAIIEVNGVDHSPHGRGHNVVVVNYQTGVVESSASFDTHGNQNAGRFLRDYLLGIKARRIVLIAVQENSDRYSTYAIHGLIAVGAMPPVGTGYCGSYALIGYKGDRKEVDFVAQAKAWRGQGPSVLSTTIDTVKSFLDLELRSEGCKDPNREGRLCGWAFIKVNEVDHSLHHRGHNVVTLDAGTGKFVEAKSFDTHGDFRSGLRLRDYLKTKTNGLIVLVAIQDDGSIYSSRAFSELKRLGAKDPSTRLRGSYCLVGYAGSPLPWWVRQEQRVAGKGPTVLKMSIPLYG